MAFFNSLLVAVLALSGCSGGGGRVGALPGAGLVLQINGTETVTVAANTTFTFPTSLPSGTAYTVTVATQPSVSREIYSAANGTGTVGTANVSDVSVNCSAVIGFLYQLDANQNQIYSYGISASTGVLIAFGPPIAAGPAPEAITVAPGENYLYVTDSNGASGLPGSVSTYAVNSGTGELTPVGLPVAAGTAA